MARAGNWEDLPMLHVSPAGLVFRQRGIVQLNATRHTGPTFGLRRGNIPCARARQGGNNQNTSAMRFQGSYYTTLDKWKNIE